MPYKYKLGKTKYPIVFCFLGPSKYGSLYEGSDAVALFVVNRLQLLMFILHSARNNNTVSCTLTFLFCRKLVLINRPPWCNGIASECRRDGCWFDSHYGECIIFSFFLALVTRKSAALEMSRKVGKGLP